jgi:DNA primase small subunit
MPVTTREYYNEHYPWEALVAFLTRKGDELCKREFAVEGDYYKRYVVAKDADELKSEVLKVRGLRSFHIGPVYNERVARGSAHAHSRPVRRELVFDLDLTDYDFLSLETPEGGVDAVACDKAWCVCAVGIFVLQWLLTNAFGFNEFVVVYSGRRGAHLYVCDDKAMDLGDEARAAITDFFKFVPSEDNLRAHPSTRAVMVAHGLSEALHHIFETHFIKELELFETPSQRVAFVERLGFSDESFPTVGNLAEDVIDESMSGLAMWEFLKTKVASLPHEWMRNRIDDMMLSYVWPRIDAGVSRHLNHLLKAPFVAHPKTGRVAVPVNAVDYFRFKAFDVPTLDNLHASPFAEHESVRWLRPCRVDDAVAAPSQKKKLKMKKKKSKNKNDDEKNPKMNREKASGTITAFPQDVDMEDLVGAAPRQSSKRTRPLVRKSSPLSTQSHTAPPVAQGKQ